MRCEECRLLLRPYLDHEMSLARRAPVAAHVLRCRDCAARLRGIRALACGIAALDAPEGLPTAAAPPRRWRGVARLAVEVAVAIAIGFGSFKVTDCAFRPHPRDVAPTVMASAVDCSAPAPRGPMVNAQDVGPEMRPW